MKPPQSFYDVYISYNKQTRKYEITYNQNGEQRIVEKHKDIPVVRINMWITQKD